MKKKTTLAMLASTGVFVASTTVLAAPKWAKPGSTIVKCAGIAKKGMNDCGANGHQCAGKAARDNDPNEWVYVPAGVCERIAGGRIYKTKKVPQ